MASRKLWHSGPHNQAHACLLVGRSYVRFEDPLAGYAHFGALYLQRSFGSGSIKASCKFTTHSQRKWPETPVALLFRGFVCALFESRKSRGTKGSTPPSGAIPLPAAVSATVQSSGVRSQGEWAPRFRRGAAISRGGGVADGIRTRDRRHHKPELYQLSYCHRARPNLAGGAGGWRSGSGGADEVVGLVQGVQLALGQGLGAEVGDCLVLRGLDHLQEGLAGWVFDQEDEVPGVVA